MNRRIFILTMVLTMALTGVSYADKWNKLTFTEDVALGLADLEQYCVLHDVKAEDVLWANGVDKETLKAGDFIYLPANQVDMLSIWQHKGAWNATALVPVTSAAAAKRAAKIEEPAKKTEPAPVASAPKTETKVEPEIKTEDLQALLDSMTKTKVPEQKTEPKVQVAQVEPKKVVEPQPQKIIQQPKKVSNPANVIASSAKPDKILTAKSKTTKADVPGLMDPIIILSPNGDSSHGPMRLVISGDKVEVVRLPDNAVPKRPSMADLDHTFGTMPNYLPHYNLTARPRKDNSFIIANYGSLGGRMMWPVDGKVSSYFGWRGKRKHEGIDIPMPAGTPIRAATSGVVARTGDNSTMGFRGYGNFVLLDHGNGLQSFYAHCSSVAVRQGQRIMQGQIVGYVGSTGRSTANHLHFEVRVNNAKVNPIPYLSGNSQLASKK